jgi:hypothetical protein
MEKFNNHNSESNCDSDTESAAGENDLLYEFIFGQHKFPPAHSDPPMRQPPPTSHKSSLKHSKNTIKNGRLNGKLKKTL